MCCGEHAQCGPPPGRRGRLARAPQQQGGMCGLRARVPRRPHGCAARGSSNPKSVVQAGQRTEEGGARRTFGSNNSLKRDVKVHVTCGESSRCCGPTNKRPVLFLLLHHCVSRPRLRLPHAPLVVTYPHPATALLLCRLSTAPPSRNARPSVPRGGKGMSWQPARGGGGALSRGRRHRHAKRCRRRSALRRGAGEPPGCARAAGQTGEGAGGYRAHAVGARSRNAPPGTHHWCCNAAVGAAGARGHAAGARGCTHTADVAWPPSYLLPPARRRSLLRRRAR